MSNLAHKMNKEIRVAKEVFDRNFFYYLKKYNIIKEQNINIINLVPSYTKINYKQVEIFFDKVKIDPSPILSIDLEKLYEFCKRIPEVDTISNNCMDELRIQIIFRKLIQTIIQKTAMNGFYTIDSIPNTNYLLKRMLLDFYNELKMTIKYYGTEGDKYINVLPFNLKRQKGKGKFFIDFVRRAFTIEFTPVVSVEGEIMLNINVVGIVRGKVISYYNRQNYLYSSFLQPSNDNYPISVMCLNRVITITRRDQSINYVYIVKEREEKFSVYIPIQERFVTEDIGDKVVLKLHPERVKFVTAKTLNNKVKENSTFYFNKNKYSYYHKNFFTSCNFYNRGIEHIYFNPVF